MVGGVCILILLGTISHSSSAPEPIDTVNINLNLGEGTNTGTRIPRIKIDDAHHDTSNIRICKDQSVRECVRIIVNVNEIMSAKKLILPNGDVIRDGKTLNLYGNSDHSDYRWREKPNSLQLTNPRLYKTSNNFEVMFSETDGVIAANVPSINNIEYTIEYCGGGCYLWIKRDTSLWVDDVEIPRRNPGWKNRYNRRGRKATSGGWQHSMFEDYQDTSSTLSIDDDPVRISVVVYYTNQYATAARSNSSDESPFDIQKAITELAFNQANHGLRESQVPIIYYPHCFIQTTIRDGQSDIKTIHDLESLASSNREIRKSADIAVVLVENLDPRGCGITYTTNVLNDSDPNTFSVVKRSCIISKYTFNHELAHMFGAEHNIEEYKPEELQNHTTYAHGILFRGRFCTVMSYFENENRINRFSSPNMNHEGTVIGNSSYANNAELLRERGIAMSNIGKEDMACPTTVHVCITSNTGLTCQFPFIYNGIEYNKCTDDGDTAPWCSTNVTNNRRHVEGNWDYCHSDC